MCFPLANIESLNANAMELTMESSVGAVENAEQTPAVRDCVSAIHAFTAA
jgi:hypothetical protein